MELVHTTTGESVTYPALVASRTSAPTTALPVPQSGVTRYRNADTPASHPTSWTERFFVFTYLAFSAMNAAVLLMCENPVKSPTVTKVLFYAVKTFYAFKSGITSPPSRLGSSNSGLNFNPGWPMKPSPCCGYRLRRCSNCTISSPTKFIPLCTATPRQLPTSSSAISLAAWSRSSSPARPLSRST